MYSDPADALISLFTSQHVSINSVLPFASFAFSTLFTSQHVSINSDKCYVVPISVDNLHPNMYLLIPYLYIGQLTLQKYLHPNMYLLILKLLHQILQSWYHLHPNMYLLILCAPRGFQLTHVDLHPNMYLLILQALTSLLPGSSFTSQHVSINSIKHSITYKITPWFTSQHVSINSRDIPEGISSAC